MKIEVHKLHGFIRALSEKVDPVRLSGYVRGLDGADLGILC
jgi:hypothetical protein